MNDKPMKKAIHRWELVPSFITGSMAKLIGWRAYVCKRCEAGPVRIRDTDHKSSINRNALKQGISSDCNYEIVRRIMES
jgi:hypothetical protein